MGLLYVGANIRTCVLMLMLEERGMVTESSFGNAKLLITSTWFSQCQLPKMDQYVGLCTQTNAYQSMVLVRLLALMSRFGIACKMARILTCNGIFRKLE